MTPPVYVHLDFKGLSLAPEYLCDAILPLLKRCGASGILLEWEDALPFWGELSAVRGPHAYTEAEVASLLARAAALGLDVIPLVQSIGHLEYVLKHAAFAHLREDPHEAGTLCPAHPDAHQLVRRLLSQVLALHPHCRALHIGCDEPALGASALTRAAPAGPDGLLVEHVARTVAAARELSGGRVERVLMWHDAAMGMPDACLRRLLATGATLAVWDYTSSLSAMTRAFTARLAAVGGDAPLPFAASAYKGAESCDAIVPHAPTRAANQRAWKALIDGSSAATADGVAGGGVAARLAVQGVLLTGWSRFGHTMPLCEMLPAAVPTLLRALGEWTAAAEIDVDAWITAWRREPTAAPGLLELCHDVDAARRALAVLELERAQGAPPRTVRVPSVRALLGIEARAAALAVQLRQLDTRSGALLTRFRGTLFRAAADVAEWHRATVGDATLRVAVLLATLRRDVERAARSDAHVRGGRASAPVRALGLAVAVVAIGVVGTVGVRVCLRK